jgi:hypothetical protein
LGFVDLTRQIVLCSNMMVVGLPSCSRISWYVHGIVSDVRGRYGLSPTRIAVVIDKLRLRGHEAFEEEIDFYTDPLVFPPDIVKL